MHFSYFCVFHPTKCEIRFRRLVQHSCGLLPSMKHNNDQSVQDVRKLSFIPLCMVIDYKYSIPFVAAVFPFLDFK
jgi:hypothetical protein